MAAPWEQDPLVEQNRTDIAPWEADMSQPGAAQDEGYYGNVVTPVDLPPSEVADDNWQNQHPYLAALGRGTRDVMNGVGQTADLVTLPISAIMRLAGADIRPYREVTDQFADDLGLPRSETGGQRLVSALNEGATTGLGGFGIAKTIAGAPGVVGQVADALTATPVADTAASGTSFASSEQAKQAGYGPIGQTVAGFAGGLGGASAVAGGPAAYRSVTQRTNPSELLAAFGRQQVEPMADQVGGTASRMASGITRVTLGGIPLAEAAERSIATARAARDRIAQKIGRVTDDTGAGQAARRGAESFIETSADRGSRLYDAIPIAADTPTTLSNTKRALGDLNAGLSSNPELSSMLDDPRLQGFQRALEGRTDSVDTGIVGADGNAITRPVQKGGGLSWQDLKAFRTYIGEKAGAPSLQTDTSQKALKSLYEALSADMEATAKAQGPKAYAAFSRANNFWRARQDRIENTLGAILGNDLKKSPEAAFSQIERWSRDGGDSARLARTLRSLPPDEADTVRATIFSRMGNVSAGRQDMTGSVWSPNDFATQWAKLDSRAKSVLFPGQEYRRDLDDIAKIADAMKRSGEFANTSKTALASNGIGLVTLALAGNPISAGGIAGSQFALGKLLASPRFARWLAKSPNKPNGPATLAHINRLTAIATAEPQIANEVLRLQERLASSFTTSRAPLAADEPVDEPGGVVRHD